MTLCGLIGVLALPAAAGAYRVGVSDNNSFGFNDPRFLKVGFKVARREVPWDVMTYPADTGQISTIRTWISKALQAHMQPLISIGADDGQADSSYIPTTAQYRAAVAKFVHAFPEVKTYTAWNEPDWIYRGLSKKPLLAASYYNAVRSLCHCTVLAGDVYLPAPQLGKWMKAYIKGINGHPSGWALHDYTEIRGLNDAQLTVFNAVTKSGPIWLDETGGVLSRGHWQYKNQSAAAAAKDEQYLFSLPRLFPRISVILHYQWQSAPPYYWDSGLVDYKTGKLRPAYKIVLQAAHGKVFNSPLGVSKKPTRQHANRR